jgi:hypothetical protein
VSGISCHIGGAVICDAVITFVRSPAHSGQRIPTGDGVMQSVQIGRPHDEHSTFVSRSGCL